MTRKWLHSCIFGAVLLLAGCSKMDFGSELEPGFYGDKGNKVRLATGTYRLIDGVKTVRIDASTLAVVENPEELGGIPAGSRILFEYTDGDSKLIPDFCTESIFLHWASALEQGTVSRTPVSAPGGDPMEIVTDWITSLEDGFLTVHYSVRTSGSVKHSFTLSPGTQAGEYFLRHDANGDRGGELTEGIVCFPVSGLLPDTGGETVTLSLDYLNLLNTRTRLTVDYRSPQ